MGVADPRSVHKEGLQHAVPWTVQLNHAWRSHETDIPAAQSHQPQRAPAVQLPNCNTSLIDLQVRGLRLKDSGRPSTLRRLNDENTLAVDANLTDTSRHLHSHVGGPMAVSVYLVFKYISKIIC